MIVLSYVIITEKLKYLYDNKTQIKNLRVSEFVSNDIVTLL